MNRDFWNTRYSGEEYIYGKEVNDYLAQKISNLSKGKVLLPADGEGRNSIYAAKLGWETYAFDMSDEGKVKAEKLASENKVNINYKVSYAQEVEYEKDYFDLLVLVYAHFPADIKFECNKKFADCVKINGHIIFEAFSKKQLDYQKEHNSGGPNDEKMLYSVEEIKENFPNFEIIELKEEEVKLKEGRFHDGLGSVIRFFGKREY